MSKLIAIAPTYENLKLIQTLVTSIIEFDIYTHNPVAALSPADTRQYVVVIDLESPNVELVDWREFYKIYDGIYGSTKFTRVTKK